MKINDDQFQRLLQAAKAGPAPGPEQLPANLQGRILANWRQGLVAEDWTDLVRWLQIGFGFACVLLIAAAAISFREINREARDEFNLPSVVINLAFTR